jgi:hypothetical protein
VTEERGQPHPYSAEPECMELLYISTFRGAQIQRKFYFCHVLGMCNIEVQNLGWEIFLHEVVLPSVTLHTAQPMRNVSWK